MLMALEGQPLHSAKKQMYPYVHFDSDSFVISHIPDLILAGRCLESLPG